MGWVAPIIIVHGPDTDLIVRTFSEPWTFFGYLEAIACTADRIRVLARDDSRLSSDSLARLNRFLFEAGFSILYFQCFEAKNRTRAGWIQFSAMLELNWVPLLRSVLK